MRRIFPSNPIDENNYVDINGDEFFHLCKVLRQQVGDKIVCLYNDDYEYICQIEEIGPTFARARLLEKRLAKTQTSTNLTLFQALTKGDKFEFVIQKACELGFSFLIPFESEFCVAKYNENKLDRYNNISVQACKQCGRSKIMQVRECLKFIQIFNEFKNYDLIVFANETENSNSLKNIKFNEYKNIAVIVGSEGGFSKTEIEKIITQGAVSVSLGKRILRSETASIVMCSLVSFLCGELE